MSEEIKAANRINRPDLIGKKSYLFSHGTRCYAIAAGEYTDKRKYNRMIKDNSTPGCTIEFIPSAIALERFIESEKRDKESGK